MGKSNKIDLYKFSPKTKCSWSVYVTYTIVGGIQNGIVAF